jgi:hypothetical protein
MSNKVYKHFFLRKFQTKAFYFLLKVLLISLAICFVSALNTNELNQDLINSVSLNK